MQEVLDEYWPNTTELTNICRRWSIVYSAKLANGTKCIVKAGVKNEKGDMLSDGHIGYEEIVGNYSHFINYLGDLTCPCIEPYTVVKDNFAVGVAGFVDGHAPHLLPGIETFTEEEHKAAIFALGKWLAEFHKASRNYAQEFPEEFEKINLWSEKKGGWQKDNLKPPPIPINSHTFGLIHGDFHQENVKLSKLPDQKNWKVTAFDWGELQRSWYMIDLGTVIF